VYEFSKVFIVKLLFHAYRKNCNSSPSFKAVREADEHLFRKKQEKHTMHIRYMQNEKLTNWYVTS
jgi:hypothetical protein